MSAEDSYATIMNLIYSSNFHVIKLFSSPCCALAQFRVVISPCMYIGSFHVKWSKWPCDTVTDLAHSIREVSFITISTEMSQI